jgi:hypothetical protein
MIVALECIDSSVRQSLVASHLHELIKGHVDGFWGMYSEHSARLKCPLKLLEAKKSNTLDQLLNNATTWQVENEVVQINHLHAANVEGTVSEMRVPFFQERFSSKGYCLDMLIPCQRGDLLSTCRPQPTSEGGVEQEASSEQEEGSDQEDSAEQEEGSDQDNSTEQEASKVTTPTDTVFVRVALMRLAEVPKESNGLGFPVFSAQLVVMQEMHKLYQATIPPARISWHRPLRFLEDGWVPMTSSIPSVRARLLFYKKDKQLLAVKVFDYYLRSKSDRRIPQERLQQNVPIKAMRQVPPARLLGRLKEEHSDVFCSWEVIWFHPLYSVLKYNYVTGSHPPKNWTQFVKVLEIIATAHRLNYCHADLLPQNIIYHSDGKGATVLDWDWTRLLTTLPKYVAGFNYDSLRMYRHPNAQEGKQLALVHDTWALARMAELWFAPSDALQALCTKLDTANAGLVDDVVEMARGLSCKVKTPPTAAEPIITGSPPRQPELK